MLKLSKILKQPFAWGLIVIVIVIVAIWLLSGFEEKPIKPLPAKEQLKFQKQLVSLKTNTVKVEFIYYFEDDQLSRILTGEDKDSFLECIGLIPSVDCKSCLCLGNPTIKFYGKDKSINTFTVHHEKYIRWKQFPIGNIPMTSRFKKRLRRQYVKHGIRLF